MPTHRPILTLTLLAVSAIVALNHPASADSPYRIQPFTEAQAAEYKLDHAFYKKATTVHDILIATSKNVSDHAHLETAYQFDMMMKSINPAVAQRIRERKLLCIIIGHREQISELPQFKTDKTGKDLDFYNWRSRGFLRWIDGRPVVVFSEEDVLELEGGMQKESILIHEFGHVIHGAGFDKDQQKRLTEIFIQSNKMGLWKDGYAAQRFRRVTSEKPVSLLEALTKAFPDRSPDLLKKCLDGGDILVNGKPTHAKITVTKDDKVRIVFGGIKRCYAGKNRSEYWAEVVQCWYDTNRTRDHDHNHIHTRNQLKSYDPGAARLCEEILGKADWRFVSPRQRAGQAHLKGYDPANAPKVQQPKHVRLAGLDYYDNYWKTFWQRLGDKHGFPAPPTRITKPSSDKDYRVITIKGWAIHVHNDYLSGDQAVLDNALANAELQLGNIEKLLPEKSTTKLKRIPIWITPGRRKAEYHWDRKWLIDNGRNPDMAHAVQLTDIVTLRRTNPAGAWVLLHELAHGYHDREVGPEDKRAIAKAYKDALAKGLYQKVLHTNRGRGQYIKAYAATRMEEYFAESCEAYFAVNDFYPFVRAELREYDPDIYHIIERVYHVK